MRFPRLHDWQLSTTEARDLQLELASRVNVRRRLPPCRIVAAADVSYNKFSPVLYAAVVVMRDGEIVDRVGIEAPARFPYVPGLLSFREAPAVLDCFTRLRTVPDAVLCDGQGIAHPRRFGLACHVGLWLGIPTVGCAKSRLCGEFAEPGPSRGNLAPLLDHEVTIGSVLRTRERVRPLFVSPGHLCDQKGAVRLVLETTGKYRLPEPSRQAHAMVNELRRAARPAEVDGNAALG